MVAFRDRRRAMDWNAIASAREVDDIVRDGDRGLEDIQRELDNVTFCNLRKDELPNLKLLVKGFEYAQLTIEYLLNVQEQLSSALAKGQEELEEQTARVEEVSRNERIQERRARSGAKKLRNCQSTLQAASRMLAQFGVDTTPLRRMSEEDPMDGGPAPEYVWVPAYLDPYDGKAFQSADYLKKHMFTRHAAQIKADLGYYGDGGDYSELEAGGGGGAGGATRPFDPPKDAIQDSAQRLLEEIMGPGSRKITRKKLLKELQSFLLNPDECGKFHFPRPAVEGRDATTTVHDLLHSRDCIDVGAAMNEAVVLDWRGVDAHLRLMTEVDHFLRSDLQKRFSQALKDQARDAAAAVEMKQTENLDEKAKLIFETIDDDKSGSISHEELLAAFMDPVQGAAVRETLGFAADLSETEREESLKFIKQKMKDMDSDGDGEISLIELKGFMERIAFFNNGFNLGKQIGFANGLSAGEAMGGGVEGGETMLDEVHRPEAIDLFTRLDRDGSGAITQTEFVKGVMAGTKELRDALGFDEGVTAKLAEQKFFTDLDANGDGLVSFDEIARFLDKFKHYRDGYLAAADENGLLELGEAPGGGIDLDDYDAAGERTGAGRAMVGTPGGGRGVGGDGGGSPEDAEREAEMEKLPDHFGADFWYELQVISAAHLRAADKNGKSDPLVIVKVNKEPWKKPWTGVEVWKSATVSKTLFPRFASKSAKKAVAMLKGLPMGQNDRFEVAIELWDSDGMIMKSKEFLGAVVLKKEDFLRPPLVPTHWKLGPHPDPAITGSLAASIKGQVELVWRAKATINVSILKCEGLRATQRSAGITGGKKDAAPEAMIRMNVHGCDILDAKKERRAKSPSCYESVKCKASNNPEWKGERKTIEVPLDRLFDGAMFEVVDKPTQDVLGVVVLDPVHLLTSTAGRPFTLVDKDSEEAQAYGSSELSAAGQLAAAKQKKKKAKADKGGTGKAAGRLQLSIEASPNLAAFYATTQANLERTAATKQKAWFECMEVEIKVLRAQNLAKGYEPFAKVFIDDFAQNPGEWSEIGKTKVKGTTRHPVFKEKDQRTFVVSIPFPAQLAQMTQPDGGYGAIPPTKVKVELWDKNAIKNKLLGQVELDWATLVYPSIKTYKLTDPPLAEPGDELAENGGGGDDDEAAAAAAAGGSGSPKKAPKSPKKAKKPTARAGAQGELTLQIRQMQMFEVHVLSAYGLLPADNGRTSDPYVKLSLTDKNGWASDGASNRERVSLKTEVKDKTISPQFYHRFCFSKGLDMDEKAIQGSKNKERKRRREQLKATVDDALIGPDEEKRRFLGSLDKADMLFPGLWAETKGKSAMSGAETAYTSFCSFAVEGDRLMEDAPLALGAAPADGAFGGAGGGEEEQKEAPPEGGGLAVAGGGGGGGNGERPWIKPTLRQLSLEVSVWDKDAMSKDDFMGEVDVSEAMLRDPPLGRITLPLMDNPKKNTQKLKVSGWMELQIRASVPPEVTQSPDFQNAFPPPTADLEPVIDVMLENLEAASLSAADKGGSSDPYAKLIGNGIVRDGVVKDGLSLLNDRGGKDRTKTVNSNLNPKWEKDSFTFSVPVDPESGGGRTDVEEEEYHDEDDDEEEKAGGGEEAKNGGGSASSSGALASFKNKATSCVEVQIYDYDSLGGHDFLGRAVLNVANLLTIDPAPNGRGYQLMPEDSDGKGGSGGCGGGSKKHDPTKPKKAYQFSLTKGCGTIEIMPPSGFFNATAVPLGRLEFTFMSAFNLLSANLNGKSDPYIRIQVKDSLCKKPSIYKKSKDISYFKVQGEGGKWFKTSTKEGTLSPVWYESVVVPIDLQVAFSKEHQGAGLSIEMWDGGALADRFLGRVFMDKNAIQKMLLRPLASPSLYALEDAPITEVPKGQKIKAVQTPVDKGFLQLHVRSSHLPAPLTSKDTSKCYIGDAQKLIKDFDDADATSDSSWWSTHFTSPPKTMPWPYQFQYESSESCDAPHLEGPTQLSFGAEYIEEAMRGVDDTSKHHVAAAARNDGAAAAIEGIEGGAEGEAGDGVSEQEKIELLIREMAIHNIESRKRRSGGGGGSMSDSGDVVASVVLGEEPMTTTTTTETKRHAERPGGAGARLEQEAPTGE